MPLRDISRETVRAQARIIGLEIGGEELEILVERTKAALEDIDALDEFDLSNWEPAVAFGHKANAGEDK